MTKEQCKRISEMLLVAFPKCYINTENAEEVLAELIYILLSDYDFSIVEHIVCDYICTSQFPPVLANIVSDADKISKRYKKSRRQAKTSRRA